MNYIKTLVPVFAAVLFGSMVQSQPSDVSIMVDKTNRNAVMITISQPEKITVETIRQRFLRAGLKERSKNGMTRYEGVTLSEISPDKVDIYTKVEEGPNNTSIVYMAVARQYAMSANTAADSLVTQNVKTFLQSLEKDAAHHFADVQISEQINDLGKDEKAYQRLLDEQRDLEKKRSGIESRLTVIQNELAAREKAIGKKKLEVEDAKVKRVNLNNQ